jgi:hypothetical protein
MGMQIVLLPDETLQDAGVVRQAIEDVGGRQTEPFELAAEVDADHAASPNTKHDNVAIPNAPMQQAFQKAERYQIVVSMWN